MIKKPSQCEAMPDVRAAIDHIDKQLVDLLGDRLEYIHKAADIKVSENLIRDEDRIDSMLLVREQWAKENNYDPAFIRQIFNDLIEYSISRELVEWKHKDKA